MAQRIVTLKTAAPTHSAQKGTMVWDSTNKKLYINHDGSTGWQEVGAGGATLNPETLATLGANISNDATAETDLLNYSMPANTMATGDSLHIWGKLIACVNAGDRNPIIRVRFGATALRFDAGTIYNGNMKDYDLDVWIHASGASSQIALGTCRVGADHSNTHWLATATAVNASDAIVRRSSEDPAESLSGAITIRITWNWVSDPWTPLSATTVWAVGAIDLRRG